MEAAARLSTDMLRPACLALRKELGCVRREMEAERRLQAEVVRRRVLPIPAALMEGGVDITDAGVWRAAGEGMRETASKLRPLHVCRINCTILDSPLLPCFSFLPLFSYLLLSSFHPFFLSFLSFLFIFFFFFPVFVILTQPHPSPIAHCLNVTSDK